MASKDEYVAAIKGAFFTLGREAALNYLRAQLPILAGKSSNGFLAFLGLKILSPLTAWLVGAALEGVIKNAEMAAFFFYIDMRVGAQGKDFEAAAFDNYKAQQSGTPEEKERAKKRLQDAFVKFATYSS